MRVFLIATLISLFLNCYAQAGKYNPVLSIGDDAPVWNELPATDGKQHSLSDLKDSEVVIVAFTCNSCPYAVDVEDRLNELVASYAEQKVSLVAINVNFGESDALPAMKQRSTEKKFAFAYLRDQSQQIARDFGALRTPEFFVLDQQRKVVYMGSLDDSPDAKKITKNYVQDAVNAVLAGKEVPVTETIAIGCGVRFKRKRER